MICYLNMKGACVCGFKRDTFFPFCLSPVRSLAFYYFKCVFCTVDCVSVYVRLNIEQQSIGLLVMESGELRKKDGQAIIDNNHRSNKSKRFIANGGFEYI